MTHVLKIKKIKHFLYDILESKPVSSFHRPFTFFIDELKDPNPYDIENFPPAVDQITYNFYQKFFDDQYEYTSNLSIFQLLSQRAYTCRGDQLLNKFAKNNRNELNVLLEKWYNGRPRYLSYFDKTPFHPLFIPWIIRSINEQKDIEEIKKEMNEKMNEKIKVMDIEIAKEREKMSICNVLFQTETETEIKKKSLQDAFKEVFENQRTDFPIYFIYFHWIEIEKCRKVDHYVTELIDDYSKELSCIIKGAPFIPVGLTVYKGIKNNGNKVKEYDIWDKNFHIEGFFSTSLRKEISTDFAGDKCCLLTVIVKASLFRGLFMEINTHYEGEYEILFDNDFIGYENIIPKNYDSTKREYRVELDLKFLDEDEKEDEKEEISKPKRKISEKKNSTPKRPKKNLFKIRVNKGGGRHMA